ncbi:MAG TPA: serine/threonine-protein kinase, partial [Polyangiaceae bacterium]|nr:serine/threonine-protein kinase [Polyangiaceae bacterium]
MGEILGGRYRVVEELGRGGQGVVLRAVDLKADVVVALKLIGQGSSSESKLRSFRRELKMARKITHPGVVRIYDLVEMPGRFALSMEWVDGKSLDERLERTGPMDSREIIALALDLTRALAAAHAAGVTHRDLKPANILLRAESGRAVVTDFGISRLHLAVEATDLENAPTLLIQ